MSTLDKYEYKICADEINSLIEEGEYAEAVVIADKIDWRRVKSVRMLCTISDLYKINRRYQESKDILLLAYEKHPTGRLIVYSLCELSIKMEEYVQAIEYYKEFVQIAPRDTGRYILQYRLYEAQEVSLEERIAVLEEFKKRDYREKWAYELAYLYHRIGLTTKCVEECDEMYLWFGEGKYVLKALELKALHTPLNAEQQAKYDEWTLKRDSDMEEEEYPSEEEEDEDEQIDERYDEEEEELSEDTDTMSMPTADLPQVKTVDVGEYNTLNLQMALAESMKEILTDEEQEEGPVERELEIQGGRIVEMPQRQEAADAEDETAEEEPAEEENFVEEEAEEEPSIAERIIAPLLQETVKIPKVELSEDADELQEIVPEATREFTPVREAVSVSGPSFVRKTEPKPVMEQQPVRAAEPKPVMEQQPVRMTEPEPVAEQQPAQSTGNTIYDSVLSQEYDGQIRLLVPDTDVKAVEKQITGQLSIEDIMAEWEAMKRNNEQKRMEDVRQRILEHTGSLFADFDEATKSGLLEQLEKAFVEAIMKESGIKKVILPEETENELKSKAAVRPEPPKEKELPKKPEPVKEIEEEPVYEETGLENEEMDSEITDEVEEIIEPEESEEPEVEMAEPEEEPERLPQQAFQTVRELTDEERELFGQFVHHRKSREQLVRTLDNMSMASYTGNVVITGEEGGGTLSLAKGLIREMQFNDGNFSGNIAKISGAVLNKKDISETLSRISNGALIIEKAADMKTATVTKLCRELEKGSVGLLLILEDTKQRMNELLSENTNLSRIFDLRVDIEPLDDEALVAYAKQYAEDREYSIDEFGVLALHTRIADMQTSDHEVTLAEVRELVDEAIYYANRKTPKHFMDVLFAKRYDDDDMIILRESDFIHY